MMKKKLYIGLVFTLLFAGVLLFQPSVIMATSVDRLSLCNLEGQAGEKISVPITLSGTEPDARTGFWEIYYKKTDGDTALMDISTWITIDPKEYTISQGQSLVFNVQIKIPDNAAPGLWGATSVDAGQSGHSAERRTYIIFKDSTTGGNVYSGLLIPVSVQVQGKGNLLAPVGPFLKNNMVAIILGVVIIILVAFILIRMKAKRAK